MRRVDIAKQTRIEVKRDIHSRDFPRYLASRLSVRREIAEQFVEQGCVTLDGEAVAADHMPRRGDVYAITFPASFTAHLAPTPMELSILHEDAHLVVVDKPPGVVVHPARGHMTGGTVMNGLLHRYARDDGEPPYLAVSHRIDRDTSGVVVYARTREAHRRLARQFQERRAGKRYLALVAGSPAWEETTVRAPLGPHPDDEERMAVVPEADGGKPAETVFRVLERRGRIALAEARPRSGRTHQIRVHLDHLGHPVLGDDAYGSGADDFSRQALHASRLTVRHPDDGRRVVFDAPLPEDMRLRLSE